MFGISRAGLLRHDSNRSTESHIRPVGYGAMLAEGFVAFIALVTIMIVTPNLRGKACRERFTATASAIS